MCGIQVLAQTTTGTMKDKVRIHRRERPGSDCPNNVKPSRRVESELGACGLHRRVEWRQGGGRCSMSVVVVNLIHLQRSRCKLVVLACERDGKEVRQVKFVLSMGQLIVLLLSAERVACILDI